MDKIKIQKSKNMFSYLYSKMSIQKTRSKLVCSYGKLMVIYLTLFTMKSSMNLQKLKMYDVVKSNDKTNIPTGWYTTNLRQMTGGNMRYENLKMYNESMNVCKQDNTKDICVEMSDGKLKWKINEEWLDTGNILYGWMTSTECCMSINHWNLSNKRRNKIVKSINGNRNMTTMKLMEWNTGSGHWVRQQELIQNTVETHSPDIMFITEANVFIANDDFNLEIKGYKIVKPKTWSNPILLHARIIMLVKHEINFEILSNYMEDDISAMWVKIARKGQKKLIVGGVYREHQHLGQVDKTSEHIRSQEDRWRRILSKWMAVTRGADSVVLGDMNLDFAKWGNPVTSHVTMIEETKSTIESAGFVQIVSEITRTWPGVESSIIDHIWVNIPEKVLQKFNIIDAASDHNIVGLVIRMKGIIKNSQEFKKRKWSKFNQDDYIKKVKAVNWEIMYQLRDVNLVWDFMESSLSDILKEIAPIVKIQPRNDFKAWVTKGNQGVNGIKR